MKAPLVPAAAPRALAPNQPKVRGTARRRTSARRSVRVPRLVLRWLLVAGVTRVVATILVHLWSLSVGQGGFFPLGAGDDYGYYYSGVTVYSGGSGPLAASFYPIALGWFFRLIGEPSLLLGQLLNALAGTVSVGLGVAIVRELTRGRMPLRVRKRAMNWAGGLLTFYPSLLWYSTQLLKDPILILLAMGALFCQLLFLRRARPAPIAVWVFCLFGLVLFRPYAAVAVVLGLVLFVLRYNRKWIVPVLLFTALAPAALGMGVFGLNAFAPMLEAEKLSSFRAGAYSIGGSSAGITIDYSNPVSFAVTFAYSFATAMFGPFPWQIKAVIHVIALPETLGMWLLFPLWARSLGKLLFRRAPRDKGARLDASLLLFSVTLIALVALFSDNIGANTRLRLLSWIAFFLFAAPHLARKKWKVF